MVGLIWWFTACLAVSWLEPTLAIVGGDKAAQPEPDAAVVFIQKHGHSSRVEGSKYKKYYTFIGIRYAEPPVGRRRFQRPVRQYMAGDVLATRVCKPCPQLDPSDKNAVIGDEDCLCINVFTPKMPGDETGSPVVVFFHGGNYKSGSSSPYGGSYFAQNEAILVTVQYRLGALGFLSMGRKDASGNNGLFDMQVALKWVFDYIEFFGGDRKRISLMGQGSGGSAASLLALTDDEDSAVQSVVALSGGPLSPSAVRNKDNPKQHAMKIAGLTGCKIEPIEALVKCLKNKTAKEIVLADSRISFTSVDTIRFLDDISGRAGAGARVEGPDDERSLPPIISKEPVDSLKKERRCALLTGVTSAETARAVYGIYSKMLTEKLKTVRDFVQQEVIGDLQGILGAVGGLVPLEQTNLFDDVKRYYQFVTDSAIDVAGGLAKIAEATADALFNLPAYQSVKAWGGDGSPAYLYSFEHLGNLTRGSHFLPGVTLAGTPDDENELSGAKLTSPSHGDELAYLFEALDEDGNPILEEISSTDKMVREKFFNLVSAFIRHPFGENKTSKNLFSLPKSNEQFIKIGQDITVGNYFRFCQIGMWVGLSERVTGAFCQDILNKLPKLQIPTVPIQSPDSVVNDLIKNPVSLAGLAKQEKENEIDKTNDKSSSTIKRNQPPVVDIPKNVLGGFGKRGFGLL